MLRDNWRPFRPGIVAPGGAGLPAAATYPVEGKFAWPVEDLVVELMGRREISEAAARDEAYDFPWMATHVCPDSPPEQEDP